MASGPKALVVMKSRASGGQSCSATVQDKYGERTGSLYWRTNPKAAPPLPLSHSRDPLSNIHCFSKWMSLLLILLLPLCVLFISRISLGCFCHKQAKSANNQFSRSPIFPAPSIASLICLNKVCRSTFKPPCQACSECNRSPTKTLNLSHHKFQFFFPRKTISQFSGESPK